MNVVVNIGPLEYESAWGFEPTIGRLNSAIEAAGMNVFATIDHAAGARQAGMAMPPTVVLIYGSPKGGTPLMLEAPQAALDLPLKVLVREDASGRTLILFHPIADLMEQLGVSEPLARRLAPAQSVLVKAIQP
jgi:uncharacterized protein (DUF302 family)